MKSNSIRVLLICLLFFSLPLYATCTVTDDAGRKITFLTPAKRIISLAPDITEDLFAVGAGKHIIGVVQGSDYPKEAKRIPIIGSYSGLDIEKILALKPDLVVSWGSAFGRQTQMLLRMHIPVYVISPVYLDDIPRTLQNLGCLTGNEEAAKKVASHFVLGIRSLKTKYAPTKPAKRVFFQLGSYSLMTINKKSWINQAITLCHGRNIFADANIIAPIVSWEAIIAANPDVIITDARQADWRKRWQSYPQISAVKAKQLYNINPDWIDRAGPRLLQGVTQLCGYINH